MTRPIEISMLTSSEVQALRDHGMFWCTVDETCEASPVYRVSERMQPGETVLNIVAHACEVHVQAYRE
jgi:hypothetical protein